VNRRTFLSTLGLVALTAPPAAEAQGAKQTRRIGVFYGAERIAAISDSFAARLAEMGFVNGRNIVIEERPTGPTADALLAVAKELVALPVDVLVSWGAVGSAAAKTATRTIPVVFLSVPDPVAIGLVGSLVRPGGNLTGVTFDAASETAAKRLQLLKEAIPHLSRVAVLHARHDPNVLPQLESIQRAAPGLSVHVDVVAFQRPDDLDPVFVRLRKHGDQGLVVIPGALTFANRAQIADLALAHRLPSSHAFRESVAVGGLLSLGPNYVDMAKQGATLVAKILEGAKPADLPVEQPTKFELVINMKTAKALGLTIPPSLLLRADQIVE